MKMIWKILVILVWLSYIACMPLGLLVVYSLVPKDNQYVIPVQIVVLFIMVGLFIIIWELGKQAFKK